MLHKRLYNRIFRKLCSSNYFLFVFFFYFIFFILFFLFILANSSCVCVYRKIDTLTDTDMATDMATDIIYPVRRIFFFFR